MSKVWLIASGKGGVGKSTVTAALGMALSLQERRVCIVDTDIGLRDQDALLGLSDRVVYDLLDVIAKRCTLRQALLSPDGLPRLTLLPAAQFARCKELDARPFLRVIQELRLMQDEVLIDCPAGIEKGLRAALQSRADEAIVLCTPDDVCIRDVDRTAHLLMDKQLPKPWLIVNRLVPDLIRSGEMYTAQTVSDTLDLPLLGEVPEDAAVYRALLQHRSLMTVDCEARNALLRIARRMTEHEVPLPAYGTDRLPWYRRLRRRAPEKLPLV